MSFLGTYVVMSGILLYVGIGTSHELSVIMKGKEHLKDILDTYKNEGKSKDIIMKKLGNTIHMRLKIGNRYGKIRYNEDTKVIQYDRFLQKHALLNIVGLVEMNRWVRMAGDSYQNPLKKKTKFNKGGWILFMEHLLERPSPNKFESGTRFMKKHYEVDGRRMIIFNNEDGSKKILIYEEDGLKVEADYDPIDKRIYVTSQTMLKEPYVWLQIEIVDFLEEFSERENNEKNKTLFYQQVKKEFKDVISSSAYTDIRGEVAELWNEFDKTKQEEHDILEMSKMLSYLKRKKNNKKPIDEKEDKRESTTIYVEEKQ